MAFRNQEIGWSNEAKLLREIVKRLTFMNSNLSGGTTDLADIETLLTSIETVMTTDGVTATGTVALASGRYIPSALGLQLNSDKISIQLTSNDLSAATNISPEISLDGTNWDVATEAGTDIVHSLVANSPLVKTYEIDKGMYIRWSAAGVTTGNIAYITQT